ncbi:hypothetical protein IV203_008127 [Nitzschia inconspicua]|uniref:Uncharacterized protein n=1 Tax=Nitzschia inconspicua TaxID=303405 RepID=A0A9K3PP40_9STRA|nr:hypothetical protein IV203_008127 [Nitzschia inconspicua]
MAANLATAAAIGALVSNGGGGEMNNNNNNPVVPECPAPPLAAYHHEDACLRKPSRERKGHHDRSMIYRALTESGTGATLVPNTQTVTCPLEVQSLEIPSATRGFDTTWIVENTSSVPVVVSWIVNGVEYSPFDPDKSAMDDPRAMLKPGDWTSVPTFESFVYHVRELEKDGSAGKIVLQHRAGLVPLGNPHDYPCDASLPDVPPMDPDTGVTLPSFQRQRTHPVRPCNTIDVGFRNQVGCPLHVYWARGLSEVPENGFNCGEKFRFHLGTKPAPQDFFEDWNSMTKFEGSFIGHTFVARLASDPKVVIDTHTLQPTRIVDCPNLKQKVAVNTKVAEKEKETIVEPQGTMTQLTEPDLPDATAAIAGGAATMAAAGGNSG